MSRCGYACINCGSCRGEIPRPIYVTMCVYCGFKNSEGSLRCERCGASLRLQSGVTNTSGIPRAAVTWRGDDEGERKG